MATIDSLGEESFKNMGNPGRTGLSRSPSFVSCKKSEYFWQLSFTKAKLRLSQFLKLKKKNPLVNSCCLFSELKDNTCVFPASIHCYCCYQLFTCRCFLWAFSFLVSLKLSWSWPCICRVSVLSNTISGRLIVSASGLSVFWEIPG